MAAPRRARLSTDARREQLVALGIEIFSERPFDEVSIDDIAAAAGISKGLLYHYFPSKRDFYVAVIRSAADEMQALTEPDPALEPRDRLAAALERYLEYVETHARGYATVLRAGIGSDPAVAEIVEEVRGAMVARLLDDLPVTPPGEEPPVALRVAVLEPVEARRLDEADPAAHRDAQRHRRLLAGRRHGQVVEQAGDHRAADLLDDLGDRRVAADPGAQHGRVPARVGLDVLEVALEHRGLARADLREMLIAALGGAVSAAAGADPRVLTAS